MQHKHHDPQDLPDWFIWLIVITAIIAAVYFTVQVS